MESKQYVSYDKKININLDYDIEGKKIRIIKFALDDFLYLYNRQKNFVLENKSKYVVFLNNLEYLGKFNLMSIYLKSKMDIIMKFNLKDFNKDEIVKNLIKLVNKDFEKVVRNLFCEKE